MNSFRQIFMILALTVGVLLWASIGVTPATAAQVTFSFTGKVIDVGDKVPGGIFSEGQSVKGFYTFDPNTLDSHHGIGPIGTYNAALNDPLHHYPSTNLNVSFYNSPSSPASYVALLASGPNSIEVKNPSNFHDESYEVEGAFSGSSSYGKGYHLKSFELELEHPRSNQFNDTSLPLIPPSVSSFKEKTFRLEFGYGGDSSTVTVKLYSLTSVPLPPAVILFGAGLVALIGLGARNWRRTSGVRLEV